MANTISIQVSLDPEDLAEDLLNAGGFDITKFILHLDESIADEGFTLGLIDRLIEPLLGDREKTVEYLASKALEQNFGDKPNNLWPGPSHPMYSRDFAKEWEEEEERVNTLKQIKKLLSSLVEK
jgi:hypothetical protein